MKLARPFRSLLPVAISCFSLALETGCSDPPSRPAEGAATIHIQPVGAGCDTSPDIAVPGEAAGPLACTPGGEEPCDPTEEVLVDRAKGSRVSCTVEETGDGQYRVQFSISGAASTTPGSPRLDFNVSGDVTGTTGMAQISSYETFTTQRQGTTGPTCTLTIKDIGAGQVWGHYSCPQYGVVGSAGGLTCAASGDFLAWHCNK